MKKILYTAAIMMCFTSKCMLHDKKILKNNLNELLERNIQQLQNQNSDLQIDRKSKADNSIIRHSLDIFHTTHNIMFTKKQEHIIRMMLSDHYTYLRNGFFHCTLNKIQGYIPATDIDAILFSQFIKNNHLKSAIEIANDRFLCKSDKINAENIDFIYNGTANAKNLLPHVNQEITIGELCKNNDDLTKILEFNQKLKNLIGYDSSNINCLFFKKGETELSTKVALKKAIYNLADHNKEHMNTIKELLEEYCNLKNYYFYGPKDKYIENTNSNCNSLDKLNETDKQYLEQDRRREIENFFIYIADVIEKDSEVCDILLKYITTEIADKYTAKAIMCKKYKLAEKFANTRLERENIDTIIANVIYEPNYHVFLEDSAANIKNIILKKKQKKHETYTTIIMQIALSAIKERCFILAHHFLKRLSSIIKFNTNFTYKNKHCTFISYYADCMYNRTRYFIEYDTDKWKMLNTNANEKLEKLIGWNKEWQQQNNIKDCKLQKGCKEIVDILWSIKPQNFDILCSFVEEFLQYKLLSFNAIFKYNDKFYTLYSTFMRHIVEKHYNHVGDITRTIGFLVKNNFNMFIPNLKRLKTPYTDINFIKIIKKNDYAAIKNFTKYFLNDLRNYQTRNVLRFTAGLQLCVDIINKMVEIQSSCN